MSERFSSITTVEAARQLLEELRSAGILKGEPGVYMLDEATAMDADASAEETAPAPASEPDPAPVADADTTDETESQPEPEPEPEPEPDSDSDSDSGPDWIYSKPAGTTAMPIVMALVKATALAGTVYMAYRTSRRLGIAPGRL